MSIYILGIIVSLAVLVFTVEIMRRGLVRERSAAIWTVVASLMLFFAIFNQALVWVSSALAFKTPSNFLFFCSVILLLFISVQYSYELGKVEDQNRKMAIEIAIIKNEIKKLSE